MSSGIRENVAVVHTETQGAPGSTVRASDSSSERGSFMFGNPPSGAKLPRLFNIYASSVVSNDQAEMQCSENAHDLLRSLVKSVSDLQKNEEQHREKVAHMENEITRLRQQIVALHSHIGNRPDGHPSHAHSNGVQTRSVKRRSSGSTMVSGDIVFEYIEAPGK